MTLTQTQPMQGQLAFAGEIRRYILGGNATFTLKSKRTGERFTYQVKSAKKDRNAFWSTGNQDRTKYFVSLLTGGDNENSYTYMGMMNLTVDGAFVFGLTKGSKMSEAAPSVKAFEYVWKAIENGAHFPSGVEFWHEGSCCVCGRKLTVPESVADGIGPECKGKVGL